MLNLGSVVGRSSRTTSSISLGVAESRSYGDEREDGAAQESSISESASGDDESVVVALMRRSLDDGLSGSGVPLSQTSSAFSVPGDAAEEDAELLCGVSDDPTSPPVPSASRLAMEKTVNGPLSCEGPSPDQPSNSARSALTAAEDKFGNSWSADHCVCRR